jgi:hypothetical protein
MEGLLFLCFLALAIGGAASSPSGSWDEALGAATGTLLGARQGAAAAAAAAWEWQSWDGDRRRRRLGGTDPADPSRSADTNATTDGWGSWSVCTAGPTGVPHLNVSRSAAACAGTRFGETCAYACLPGYDASGSATCAENNTWNLTHSGSECLPAPCSSASLASGVPHLAASDCDATPSNASCAFACLPGYVPTTAAQCQLGQWLNLGSGGATCAPAPCTFAPVIENISTATASNCAGTASGKGCAIMSCLPHHSATSPAQCLLGEWQVPLPACTPHCMSAPPAADASASSACVSTPGGQSCLFTCPGAPDQLPSGPERCLLGGYWEGIQVCEDRDDCRVPDAAGRTGYVHPNGIGAAGDAALDSFSITGWACADHFVGTADASVCPRHGTPYVLRGYEQSSRAPWRNEMLP